MNALTYTTLITVIATDKKGGVNMDTNQCSVRLSERPKWELITFIARWQYSVTREIPWYAIEARDVTTMAGVKAYYI